MSKVIMFCAEGFEEIEGLTVVDILRRAGETIDMVSITDNSEITGSHGISIKTDKLAKDTDFSQYDMLVLPGGMPGTNYLKEDETVKNTLLDFNASGKYIAAICAAPTVLAKYGILDGKTACCYESHEDKLVNSKVVRDPVVVDGNVITSRGLGTALTFSLKLVEILQNSENAEKIAKSIML